VVSRGQLGEYTTVVNLSFLDRSHYYSYYYYYYYLLIYPHDTEWTPLQAHRYA
jgi:hypothetical protein